MRFKADHSLLYSRGEPDDIRLGDVCKMPTPAQFSKSDWNVTIIGFPDDRGVALNRGRVGARSGPAEIRKWLYRLVPPSNDLMIADLGDLVMSDDLSRDHDEASSAIAFGLSHSRRVVVLGGGHDWGFAPIRALSSAGRTGFLNIDAHLDVRASKEHHSGTPYWRALESHVLGEDAIWFGIQRSATSRMHEDYVCAKGGRIHFADGDAAAVKECAHAFAQVCSQCESVDVSLDMDVFGMGFAPGVSAPQPAGISVQTGLHLLAAALAHAQARTFGVYELSPVHDLGDMTARLAARCVWEALKQ